MAQICFNIVLEIKWKGHKLFNTKYAYSKYNQIHRTWHIRGPSRRWARLSLLDDSQCNPISRQSTLPTQRLRRRKVAKNE